MRVLIKPETLQRVGAFKFRGAYNRLVQLTPDERKARRRRLLLRQPRPGRGAGGEAARHAGADRHAVRRAGHEDRQHPGYGAEVKLYDRLTESREAIAAAVAAERGAVVVPAFDDPHIIAGQGTVGLEMVRQAQALGAELDVVIAPGQRRRPARPAFHWR